MILFFALGLFAQNPKEKWQQYQTPEEAGWSTAKLQEAEAFAQKIGSSAFMIIYDGKVVDYWGDIERRFMCHSVRKSLLTTMYGFYVDQGQIDISKTLADLGIDDIHQLTEQEKTAKISDLLKARSGVFHPAAYETEAMKAARPGRDSHKPNTFWYYNNWDFNTLCHILMLHSGIDFFEDFQNRIAKPLQMEDFRLIDTYYHLEAEHSQFPAYPFRMSARDLARIGQLYLQEGQWNGQQLVSAKWIQESTTTYSENTRSPGRGYGYMWWTGIYGDEHRNYSAQGVGNQSIIVYPDDHIVLVNRANTYLGESVKTSDLVKLTKMVFAARIGKVKTQPIIQTMPDQFQQFVGHYIDEEENAFSVFALHGQLVVKTANGIRLPMVPLDSDRFYIPDANLLLQFQRDESGQLTRLVTTKRNF